MSGTSPLHVAQRPLTDRERGERVYRGELIVFKNVAAMTRLIAVADGLIREAFAMLEPEAAQFHLERKDYLERIEDLRKTYGKSAEVKSLCRAVLEEVGADPARNYWDWRHLRVQPHGAAFADAHYTLDFHRDSWASNLYQQTNWWAPIYPVTHERTIAFRLDCWSEEVANTSAGWDIEALRAHRARGAPYPLLPLPTKPVALEGAYRVVIEPGDVLCFSSAHLHGSVPNESGRARFSTEFRTVNIDDMREGQGAPNVDGNAPRTAHDWFRRVSDGLPLPEVLDQGADGN